MLRLLQSSAGVAFLLLAGCAHRASLRQAAEAAEDSAIRYADQHDGVHSGHFQSMAEYGRVRDRRMAEAFQAVAAKYGVPEEQVRETLAQRPLGIDLAVVLSFAVFYIGIVFALVRGRSTAMLLYLSIIASVGAVLLCEWWAGLVEGIRLGTGHLSYRATRIPWSRHRLAVFLSALMLYWLVIWMRWPPASTRSESGLRSLAR
jgi:hypothetical protein